MSKEFDAWWEDLVIELPTRTKMRSPAEIAKYLALQAWIWQDAHYQPLLDAKDAEIARLKERLEIAYVYDKEGHKQPAPEGTPDGIECRDDTIKQLEERIAAKDALLEQAREGLEFIRDTSNDVAVYGESWEKASETLAAINAATGEK